MKHKCKKCGHFERGKGCTICYPPAKCSGNLEIECKDFITPEQEEKRQEKLFKNFRKAEKRN